MNQGQITELGRRGVVAVRGADAVAFGQWFIANPDLPERLKRNAPLNAPRPDKFYAPSAEGYTDYPVLQANG